MKILIRRSDDIFGMANLNPYRTNLPVIIWSDHGGAHRGLKHSVPRLKIGTKEYQVSVSISKHPEILAKSANTKKSDMVNIQKGMEYVSRNYDLFLKHFNDEDFDFDDEDLFNELRKRGEYK